MWEPCSYLSYLVFGLAAGNPIVHEYSNTGETAYEEVQTLDDHDYTDTIYSIKSCVYYLAFNGGRINKWKVVSVKIIENNAREFSLLD